MFCPKCGRKTESSPCVHCNNNFEQYLQPYTGKIVFNNGDGNILINLSNNFIECPECGFEMDLGDSYCFQCGKSLTWAKFKYKIKKMFHLVHK